MKVVRRYPRIGAMPELLTFRCEQCGHVETIGLRGLARYCSQAAHFPINAGDVELH
jgi:hypothetical protein